MSPSPLATGPAMLDFLPFLPIIAFAGLWIAGRLALSVGG